MYHYQDLLVDVTDAAATFNTITSNMNAYGHATQLRAQLDVTATAGTSETLDVKIQDTLDGTNWNDLMTFTQATGTTREIEVLTTPFAKQVRANCVIGGTTPTFTFTVRVIAKG